MTSVTPAYMNALETLALTETTGEGPRLGKQPDKKNRWQEKNGWSDSGGWN